MVYSTRRFVVCLSMCHFVLVFFCPFSIAITSLGEERANLSAFRTFVRFVLVWICLLPLPRGLGRAAVCDCGNSVVKFNIQGLKPEMKRLCTLGHKSVEDKVWICQQCANSLKKNNLNKYLPFCQARLR